MRSWDGSGGYLAGAEPIDPAALARIKARVMAALTPTRTTAPRPVRYAGRHRGPAVP